MGAGGLLKTHHSAQRCAGASPGGWRARSCPCEQRARIVHGILFSVPVHSIIGGRIYFTHPLLNVNARPNPALLQQRSCGTERSWHGNADPATVCASPAWIWLWGGDGTSATCWWPGQELQELGFEISLCSMLSKQDQVPGVHPCDGEFRKCFSSSTCVLLGKIHPSD